MSCSIMNLNSLYLSSLYTFILNFDPKNTLCIFIQIHFLASYFQFQNGDFLKRIKKIQLEEKLSRRLEMKTKKHKAREGQFELRCQKCSEFICMSSDIKTIQHAHHAALCNDILERMTAKKTNGPSYTDTEIQANVGRLYCKKCGEPLGMICIYKGVQFPVLKIDNLLIEDAFGNKSLAKKWKNAPFIVTELSNDDLLEIINDDNRSIMI